MRRRRRGPNNCPTEFHYGNNPAAGHFATVNGIRIYYEIYGSGPPLLLIHGNGGSIWGMRCQISYFSHSYQVIAADSRGHGKSEDGSGPLKYQQMADDLAKLLTELKVSSAAVLGQSYFGAIAWDSVSRKNKQDCRKFPESLA